MKLSKYRFILENGWGIVIEADSEDKAIEVYNENFKHIKYIKIEEIKK